MINKALKLVRQFHSIKQNELADTFCMSKSYLSEIESGKKPVSFDLLEKYSKKFDIPTSSLVFFSESLQQTKGISNTFRSTFSGKILNIMEWLINKNASEESKIKD